MFNKEIGCIELLGKIIVFIIVFFSLVVLQEENKTKVFSADLLNFDLDF